MRKSRFTEEQIVAIIKESEGGTSTPDLIRRHGISRNIFYNWRRKSGGLEVGDARKLKQLEDENRRLKRIVSEQQLNITDLMTPGLAGVHTEAQDEAAVPAF